jgi:ectoine hydroxylase-related dioxygenase (phytanoyl-CoA dioxygenase family)
MFARVNWNLPGSSAQHWHMDGTFSDDFILCNIAIIDITRSNGPMEVIPGSHAEFYPFWRFTMERRAREATPILLDQGDILIRTSTLWHRGTPNRSNAVRPMMSLSFGEKEATEEDPFKVGGGGISFYPNWYRNSSELHVLRERLEKALPASRSAGRLAKSLLRPRGFESY